MSQAGSMSFISSGQKHLYFTSHALSSPLNLSAVYLSMYYSLAFCIVLSGELIRSSTIKGIVAAYFAVLIILCSSVAGMLSMTLIFCLWLVQTRSGKILIVSMAIALTATISAVAWDRKAVEQKILNSFKFAYTYEDGSLSNYTADRLVIWDAAMNAVASKWLAGHGTGDGQYALERKYAEQNLTRELQDRLNPHNQFVSTMLDLGVIGVTLLCVMVAFPLTIAIRYKAFLYLGFLLVSIVFFCAESVLVRQKGIVFLSFFYCLLVPGISGGKKNVSA
jgi:O-antigen ligase